MVAIAAGLPVRIADRAATKRIYGIDAMYWRWWTMMFAVVVAAMEEEVALQSLLLLQADCCHRIATTADCRNKKKREDLCNTYDEEKTIGRNRDSATHMKSVLLQSPSFLNYHFKATRSAKTTAFEIQ